MTLQNSAYLGNHPSEGNMDKKLEVQMYFTIDCVIFGNFEKRRYKRFDLKYKMRF